MKKIFALLLGLVLMASLAACGSQELTMQELIDANQTQTLLKTYDSIYIHGTTDGELYVDYYLTDTYSYEKTTDWALYTTDNAGYACADDTYHRIVFLSRNGLVDFADYRTEQYADAVLSEESLPEKIRSAEDTGNQLTVKSVMKENALEKTLGVESLHSLENTYVLDAETYSIISEKSTLTFDDKTTIGFLMECSYNGEMPDEIKPFLEYETQTENLRTITLVFHVGTEKETVEYIQAPKGLIVSLAMPYSFPDEEMFSVYADAACTELYASNGDYTSDITVYIQ